MSRSEHSTHLRSTAMHDELVSIIMPAYNVGRYMTESINSVLAQTHVNWELIIVDDGSTDDTAAVVQVFVSKDSRIKYFWQKNGKQGRARNLGIRFATGDLIALLDADDVWVSNKLEVQMDAIKRTGDDVIFGNAYCIKNDHYTSEQTGGGTGDYRDRAALQFLLEPGVLVVSSVLIRKSAVKEVGGFTIDERIQYCEDWHFWLKLALAGKSFHSEPQILCYYRIHPRSVAQTEKDANTKFYFALLDLHRAYPSEIMVKNGVWRRALDIVYNKPILTSDVVASIVEFMIVNHFSRVPALCHHFLFALNTALFRKFFPMLVSNNQTR